MKYDFAKAYSTYQALLNERSDFEAEWRQISQYLLPGRGIFTGTTKPTKRKLTSPKVINTVAEDALYVLTSGMHGGLTSPSRPWFRLEWQEAELKNIEPLKAWLQECERRLHDGLHASNFYSVINSFYIEYAGFGTGSMYVGHDTYDDMVPFRFELLTAGEYTFSTGADGRPNQYFRVIHMTQRQLVDRFGRKVSAEIRKRVKENESTVDSSYVSILECVKKETYNGMPYTRIYFELQTSGSQSGGDSKKEPLEVSGFHEFPYPIARWGTIGSDIFGIGPGSRALPDVKRLQEMEKSFLMATHKTINPPLNAPARMRGKLNTLPGGYNYYANPQETVSDIYQVRFDFNGVSAAVERVEQRIQRNFFNDIFLTAARDPNATPYKATEVNAREQEKMLRLGPVIERLQHEFLQPVIERCFNIMMRKEMFPELSPDLASMAGDYEIQLISPLATAQRSVALQGINSFMAFIGNAAQFDQSILDNVNIDAAAREYADITGVNIGVLRPEEEVQMIRQQRAKAEAEQRAKEEQMAMAGMQAQLSSEQAAARKDEAAAALNQIEAQQLARQSGLM
jgi:hypothetical protein